MKQISRLRLQQLTVTVAVGDDNSIGSQHRCHAAYS